MKTLLTNLDFSRLPLIALITATLIIPSNQLTSCRSTTGPVNPVRILGETGVEYAYPHFSNDGKRILFESNETGFWRLCVLTLQNDQIDVLTGDSVNSYFPDWSPDNSRICFVSDSTGNEQIYLMNSDGSHITQLTHNGARNIHPYWSPNGSKILFNSTMASPDNLEIFQMKPDGTGITRITQTSDQETCARLFADSDRIVYLRNNNHGLDDIFMMSLNDSSVTNLTNTPARDGWPTWTPDGSAVVYATIDNGSFKLFRYNIADGSRRRLTDPPPGSDDCRANVSPDGKRIVFNRQTDDKNGRTNAIWILSL